MFGMSFKFNDFVSHAMFELGGKFDIPYFHDTAAFIKIITTWWDIVNLKTPHKSVRLNSVYQQPITSPDSEPKIFLIEFLEWLSNWGQMKQIGGKLTRETYSAIVHTSNALLEISDYV